MKDLEILKKLFESQGVHFKEADLTDLDTDDQNQEAAEQSDTEQTKENPVAVDVDSGVDSADQVSENVQLNQDRAEAAKAPTPVEARGQAPASPKNLQLADGTDSGVAVDTSNQVDALDPDGIATIEFKNGNYNEMSQIPNKIAEKTSTISRTVIPLIQVALIELLGNNKTYTSENFESTFTMEATTPIFNVNLTFKVNEWIGNDIALSSISEDANYVLNRINVVKGVNYTKCEIDCNTGCLNISFTY